MDHCSGGDGAYAIDYLSYLENWVEHHKAPDRVIGSHVNAAFLIAHPDESANRRRSPEERLWATAFALTYPLDAATPTDFTRPIYPYPARAQYSGSGNINSAMSFVCVGDRNVCP